jgi:hypothetical protein
LQPLQLYVAAADLRQFVLSLLHKPAVFAAPEHLRKPDAISGEMPRFPFTSSESVFRETPRASAASVIVKPKGSMHWRNTTPPGCGGFLMVMGWFLSHVTD